MTEVQSGVLFLHKDITPESSRVFPVHGVRVEDHPGLPDHVLIFFETEETWREVFDATGGQLWGMRAEGGQWRTYLPAAQVAITA